MPFHVKKGAADPFRGDWYIPEKTFDNAAKAVALAMMRTQENYHDLRTSWEQYGYEWSVFEQTSAGETKIWEGFKAIKVMMEKGRSVLHVEDGNVD